MLRHAGVTAALADSGLVEWCLSLEELGTGCHDITTVRAGLAFLDAHPGEQVPDAPTAAAPATATATTDCDLLLCAAYAVGLGRTCLVAVQNPAAEAADLPLARVAQRHLAVRHPVVPGGAGDVEMAVDHGGRPVTAVPVVGGGGAAPQRELGVPEDPGWARAPAGSG